MVSLLTDYGLEDGFAGALHGVLRRSAPGVAIVDITHNIRPQDVRSGSQALLRAAPYLAPGAVVAVVDPGVATPRRAVAAAAGELVLIGPDNGLLPPALDALGGTTNAVELQDNGYWLASPGPTFAGRDIFAPAAGVLAAGGGIADLGTPIDPHSLERLPTPVCRAHEVVDDEQYIVEAEATWVDRFGNIQLAAGPGLLPPTSGALVRLGQACWRARVVRAFAELAPAELGLFVDSYGHLALCVNGGSAAGQLGAREQDIFLLSACPPGGAS